MELEEVIKNIYHLSFPNQEELTKTFLRFQEHFESPKFRGKIFTLDEYKEWYTKTNPNSIKKGRFTYYEDWNGFNIPSYILKPFYEGKFDPLSEREKILLDTFADKKGKFYIIGTHEKVDASSYLKHELAHGLFYSNPEYKQDVIEALEKVPTEEKERLSRYLENKGYHPAVIFDEIHAYLLTCLPKLKDKDSYDITPVLEHSKILNEIYEMYINVK